MFTEEKNIFKQIFDGMTKPCEIILYTITMGWNDLSVILYEYPVLPKYITEIVHVYNCIDHSYLCDLFMTCWKEIQQPLYDKRSAINIKCRFSSESGNFDFHKKMKFKRLNDSIDCEYKLVEEKEWNAETYKLELYV